MSETRKPTGTHYGLAAVDPGQQRHRIAIRFRPNQRILATMALEVAADRFDWRLPDDHWALDFIALHTFYPFEGEVEGFNQQ